ncbi:MAG: hypothetical protein IJ503_09700 [Akkermansia sp.]|nr:hypothetical protein [Akkermansia sp.]
MMRLINKMPECRFVPPATKMQETRNKMPAGERLLIRKSALSAIFYCGFGAGKYYLL